MEKGCLSNHFYQRTAYSNSTSVGSFSTLRAVQRCLQSSVTIKLLCLARSDLVSTAWLSRHWSTNGHIGIYFSFLVHCLPDLILRAYFPVKEEQFNNINNSMYLFNPMCWEQRDKARLCQKSLLMKHRDVPEILHCKTIVNFFRRYFTICRGKFCFTSSSNSLKAACIWSLATVRHLCRKNYASNIDTIGVRIERSVVWTLWRARQCECEESTHHPFCNSISRKSNDTTVVCMKMKFLACSLTAHHKPLFGPTSFQAVALILSRSKTRGACLERAGPHRAWLPFLHIQHC